jgi:uncharacterized membrane protein
MDWHNGWGWMWMGLMMLLFWGGLTVLVVLLLPGTGFGGRKDQAGTPVSGPDATEILRARFARGDSFCFTTVRTTLTCAAVFEK